MRSSSAAFITSANTAEGPTNLSPDDEQPKLTPGMLTHDVEVEGRQRKMDQRNSSGVGDGGTEENGEGKDGISHWG